MKILTLNTWQERGPWEKRWELILKGLEVHQADIVGFQEVFNMDWAKTVQEQSGYPYLAVSGEHSGLIFLSRFKPLEQKCLVMKTKSPTEDYLRYAFYVRVEAGKGPIAVVNTHLSWKADEHEVRKKQVLELVDFVDASARDLLTVIVGDFNTDPDTEAVRFLREKQKWVDAFGKVHPEAVGLTWDYKNPYAALEKKKMAERRIDYVFIRQPKESFQKICSAEVVFNQPSPEGIYPSDHFGVLVDIAV